MLKFAMMKGCAELPEPAVLTDATMEKLALTKFVSQESNCEVCGAGEPLLYTLKNEHTFSHFYAQHTCITYIYRMLHDDDDMKPSNASALCYFQNIALPPFVNIIKLCSLLGQVLHLRL